MIYADVQAKLKAGDILAFRRTGFISGLVEHVSGGSYSHIGIVLADKAGPIMLEAREFVGVRVTAIHENLPCDWIATHLVWSPEIEAFARSHVGERYDYLDALKVGLGLEPSAHGEICSLLAAELLNRAGLPVSRRGCTPSALVDDLLDRDLMLRHIAFS